MASEEDLNPASPRGDESIPIPNSERRPVPGASRIGDLDPEEKIRLLVALRPRLTPGPAPTDGVPEIDPKTRHMTLQAIERTLGSSEEDRELVKAFALHHGLTVEAVNGAFRTVRISGTPAAVSAAFDVQLGRWQADARPYLSYTGPIRVPAHLEGIVKNVLGLDTRPIFRRPRMGPATPSPGSGGVEENR